MAAAASARRGRWRSRLAIRTHRKLAFDARGVLHLVHAESRGGPFEPSAIRHLRSTDGGRSFGPAREISSPLPAGYASAAFPALGIDGADAWW